MLSRNRHRRIRRPDSGTRIAPRYPTARSQEPRSYILSDGARWLPEPYSRPYWLVRLELEVVLRPRGPGFSWSSLVLSHLSLVLGGVVGLVLVGVHGRVDEERRPGRRGGGSCHSLQAAASAPRGLEPLRGALRPSPGGNQGRVSLSDAGKRGTTIDIRPSDAHLDRRFLLSSPVV